MGKAVSTKPISNASTSFTQMQKKRSANVKSGMTPSPKVPKSKATG